MKAAHWCASVTLFAGLFFLASCVMPQVWIDEVLPTVTPIPPATPAPLPKREPTPYANGRVAGKVCRAGVDVVLESCCPPWQATYTSDPDGAYAFESLTAGTFTVTCGLYSQVVTLATSDSQVNVDLCPPPTQPPLANE